MRAMAALRLRVGRKGTPLRCSKADMPLRWRNGACALLSAFGHILSLARNRRSARLVCKGSLNSVVKCFNAHSRKQTCLHGAVTSPVHQQQTIVFPSHSSTADAARSGLRNCFRSGAKNGPQCCRCHSHPHCPNRLAEHKHHDGSYSHGGGLPETTAGEHRRHERRDD